jgi:hypothetical protein
MGIGDLEPLKAAFQDLFKNRFNGEKPVDIEAELNFSPKIVLPKPSSPFENQIN